MKKKHYTHVKAETTRSRLPNVDTKMVTKEEVIKELHNLRKLRRMTTRVVKIRDLKVSATIAGRRATSQGLLVQEKFVESNVPSSNIEIEEKWDGEAICLIEENELALMAMIGEHIDYEDDWIIDSACSNHMIDNQSGAMEEG